MSVCLCVWQGYKCQKEILFCYIFFKKALRRNLHVENMDMFNTSGPILHLEAAQSGLSAESYCTFD